MCPFLLSSDRETRKCSQNDLGSSIYRDISKSIAADYAGHWINHRVRHPVASVASRPSRRRYLPSRCRNEDADQGLPLPNSSSTAFPARARKEKVTANSIPRRVDDASSRYLLEHPTFRLNLGSLEMLRDVAAMGAH